MGWNERFNETTLEWDDLLGESEYRHVYGERYARRRWVLWEHRRRAEIEDNGSGGYRVRVGNLVKDFDHWPEAAEWGRKTVEWSDRQHPEGGIR